jgi:hypothetical protein
LDPFQDVIDLGSDTTLASLTEVKPNIRSVAEALMERPVATVGTVSRTAVHPLPRILDNQKPRIRVERIAVNRAQVVPNVSVRVDAVLELIDALKASIREDADGLRAAVVSSDTRGPVARVRFEDLERLDAGFTMGSRIRWATPGILGVDWERAVVLDVAKPKISACFGVTSGTVDSPFDSDAARVTGEGMQRGDFLELFPRWTCDVWRVQDVPPSDDVGDEDGEKDCGFMSAVLQ